MKLKWIGCLPFLFVGPLTWATPSFELMEYMDQQISLYDQAVGSCSSKLPEEGLEAFEARSSSSDLQSELMYLRVLWVRVRPRVSFSLPGLVTVQIIPEIEMGWKRENPAGWVNYTPE